MTPSDPRNSSKNSSLHEDPRTAAPSREASGSAACDGIRIAREELLRTLGIPLDLIGCPECKPFAPCSRHLGCVSSFIGCYLETRPGDPPLFDIGVDGRAVVRLNGYAIVPLDTHPELRWPRDPNTSRECGYCADAMTQERDRAERVGRALVAEAQAERDAAVLAAEARLARVAALLDQWEADEAYIQDRGAYTLHGRIRALRAALKETP